MGQGVTGESMEICVIWNSSVFLRFCSGLCVKAYKVWDKESLVGGSMEICVLWEIVVPIEEWYKFFEQGDNSSGRRGYNDNKNSPWLRLMI